MRTCPPRARRCCRRCRRRAARNRKRRRSTRSKEGVVEEGELVELVVVVVELEVASLQV